MRERTVYLNGEYLAERQAHISIFDRGLMFGDTVYDVTRTFRGRPFRLHEHLERLYRSLRYARIQIPLEIDEMERISQRVVQLNTENMGPDDDVFVRQLITRGLRQPADHSETDSRPTVIVYCEPVPFASYARLYRDGVHLVTTAIRRVPPSCLSTQAKIANKMPLILGSLIAKERDPDAYPLFLDLQGFIAESDSSNVLLVRGDRILSPRRQDILEGVSRATVFSLAERIGKRVVEDDLTVYDAVNADEVLLTTTSFCVLPVCRVDSIPIGDGKPGETAKALLKAWSDEVGVDIVGQALAHLSGGVANREP